jgi:hypothetical protein
MTTPLLAQPQLPPGTIITWNMFYLSQEPQFLSQDLFLAELPNGILLDVSWSPEHDMDGSYWVTACRRGNWDQPLVERETRSPEEAVAIIEAMAYNLSRSFP